MLSRLPWTPAPETKPKPKPRPRQLNRDRRRHFVNMIAGYAKAARDSGEAATLLNFEGAFRHGLRVRFIGEGRGWQEADDMAADIVATAFQQIGARRPTWEEGQPEYSQQGAGALIARTRCINCHRPLPENHRKFCSWECANAQWQRDNARATAADWRAYDMATRHGRRRETSAA